MKDDTVQHILNRLVEEMQARNSVPAYYGVPCDEMTGPELLAVCAELIQERDQILWLLQKSVTKQSIQRKNEDQA